jgi:hypothetical protein
LSQVCPFLNKDLPQSARACGNFEHPEGLMAKSC